MLTIDNFEHIRVAYGGPVAGWVAGVARNMIARWLGSRAELGQPQGDVIPGRLLRQGPVGLSGQPGLSGAHASAGGRSEALFSGLPPLLVAGRDYVVCVVLSVAWVPDYSGGQYATDGAAPVRDPFFGEPPGRGRAWIQRYRADMATAAGVLAAIGKGAAAPLTAADRNAAGMAGLGGVAGARATLPPTGFAIPPVAGHLAYVWQPVRDADDGDAVLFYEMCPQLVGADGVRRDLADVRRALERLGLVAALDRHLADHALDVLASSPDLAIGVQISAQSTSAPAAWAGLFQRITGDRALARRMVVAITETASFPDFGGAIRFVSRLQALGCAVSIDNFGMGYTSIRELLALSPDLVSIDPFFVSFGLSGAREGAALEHLAGLANIMAATVVAKGVSDERQSHLVRQKGISWQQGEYLGAPRLGRPGTSFQQVVRCKLQDCTRRRAAPAGAFLKQ